MRFVLLCLLCLTVAGPVAAAEQAPLSRQQFEQILKGLEKKHRHAPMQSEQRYSYWGYRHAELHRRGLVEALQKSIQGKSCCDGVSSGECRVTAVNLPERLALIDGQWCPLDEKTAIRPLPGLEAIEEEAGEKYPVALVCASLNMGRCDTTAYCVGVKPGL